MANVIVTNREGNETSLEIRPGMTLMQTITDAGISELLALCGGVCSCATCHVYVEGDSSLLPAVSDDEDGLLDGAEYRKENSRLSCQIRMSESLDGLRVTVAPED